MHWASTVKSFGPNRESTVDFRQCEGVTDALGLSNFHSGKNRIATQCILAGPSVPSDHSGTKTKKVVTRCSGSYAAITGEFC